jgi:xanthosine utilization system XapX-like protein
MGWLRRIVAALFSTRARTTGTVAVMGLVGVSTYVGTTAIPSPAPATCDRTATTATFTTQVTAATAGQVVCLDAGNYGTWAPANFNKAITLVSTDGSQSASLFVTFNNGDGGVTFSKLNITGADLTGNPGPTSLTAGTGTVVRDNIIANGLNLNGGTTTSSYTNNLVTTASGACCATQIAGTPTFVGGSTPTAWGQFKLTPGSAGHAAASDGLDIGIR